MRLYWLSFSHLWGGKLEAIFSFSSIFWGWNFGKNPSFLPQAKKFNSARRYRADHSKCKILQNQILSGSNVVTASWPLYDFSILLIIWSSWETKLFFFCSVSENYCCRSAMFSAKSFKAFKRFSHPYLWPCIAQWIEWPDMASKIVLQPVIFVFKWCSQTLELFLLAQENVVK